MSLFNILGVMMFVEEVIVVTYRCLKFTVSHNYIKLNSDPVRGLVRSPGVQWKFTSAFISKGNACEGEEGRIDEAFCEEDDGVVRSLVGCLG